MNGKKAKTTLAGVIQMSIKKLSQEDIYLQDETPREAYMRVAKTVA